MQNNEIILSVSSLLLFIFLNSAGNTEARPTEVLQPYNPQGNDTFLWLGELENPNPDTEESGLGDENVLHLQLYTADDNSIIEELDQLEKLSKSNLHDTGFQDEVSAVRKVSEKVTKVSRTARNAACIERIVYRVIYNHVFQIPICKQGCKTRYKTVNFSNGRTLAIAYDCYV